jgi:hypothetical protein
MKKTILRLLITFRCASMLVALAFAVLAVCIPLAACGVPVWLSDAYSIIALVGSSFASIASFVAGLTGNAALSAALATVSVWITKVQAVISDLTELISQYQASASTGLLAQIESALADLQANVAQDFSNLGLPPEVLSVISGIAGLADNLLTEWSTAISGVKTAKTTAEFHAANAKLTTLADGLPERMKTYASDVNAILTKTTGDPLVDAALAKTPKL